MHLDLQSTGRALHFRDEVAQIARVEIAIRIGGGQLPARLGKRRGNKRCSQRQAGAAEQDGTTGQIFHDEPLRLLP